MLTCLGDCSADNQARQLALFLYETLAFICSKAQKSLSLVGPLRKSFPKSANENRGAGRQS
jgi:hypothetical protein